jgi:hypothetical protein
VTKPKKGGIGELWGAVLYKQNMIVNSPQRQRHALAFYAKKFHTNFSSFKEQ